MLRLEAYPVLDGVEVWMHATCGVQGPGHEHHAPGRVATLVTAEEIDRRGLAGALSQVVAQALLEFSDLGERARC